jgi:hypothetical protein
LLTGAVEGNSLRRGLTIKLLSGENRRPNERERERENPVCEYEWGRWEENSRPRYMGSVSALCVVQPVHPAVIPWLCAHSGGLRFGGKKQLLWDFLYPAHTDTVLWCKVAPSGDPLGHLAGEGRDGCHCIPSSSRPACKTGQEFSQQKALSCLNCLDFTDKNDFSHIKITAKARQKYSLVEFFSVFVLFCIVPHYYFL